MDRGRCNVNGLVVGATLFRGAYEQCSFLLGSNAGNAPWCGGCGLLAVTLGEAVLFEADFFDIRQTRALAHGFDCFPADGF